MVRALTAKLMGLDIPPRATILRVIWAELSRLSGHLIWIGNHAIDLGAEAVHSHSTGHGDAKDKEFTSY